MKRTHYFKIAFIPISLGLTTGLIVYWLLTLDSYSLPAIGNVLLKAVFTGVITGIVMGLLNMIFRQEPIAKK